MSGVTLTKERYLKLLKSEAELKLLDQGGVDNWEWYDLSLEGLDEICSNIEEEYLNE